MPPEKPPLVEAEPGHSYACWYPLTEPTARTDARGGHGVTETAVETPATGTEPLLPVEDLHVLFHKGSTTVQAVAGITFTCARARRSASWASPAAASRPPDGPSSRWSGPPRARIRFGDTELTALSRSDLRTLRTQVQMIFQDPISSLNPRRKVADIVAEPLAIWKIGHQGGAAANGQRHARAGRHRPRTSTANRRPREFSGGQCQRISIARALVLQPKLLVCDEIVSALDVSVQAQILNLLEDLKQEYDLTILFIAHDLAVVKNVSDRVAVMYLGRLCEIAPSDVLYETPAHHYTAALLASAVEPDPEAPRTSVPLIGEPPSPINPPSGCRFRTRCPRAEAALRRGGARDAGDGTGPPGGLPLPHRELSRRPREPRGDDAGWPWPRPPQ